MNHLFDKLFSYNTDISSHCENFDDFSKELNQMYFDEYPHICVSQSLNTDLKETIKTYLELKDGQRLAIKVPFYLKKYCLLQLYLNYSKYFNVVPNKLNLRIDIGEHMSGECLIMEII